MDFSRIKAITADIDGTLTTNYKVLPQSVMDTLEELHQKGYLLGLSSGRPVEDVWNMDETWGLSFKFDFIIALNGVELWDRASMKKYEYFMLKKEWIKDIMELMAPLKTNANAYFPGEMMVSWIDDSIIASCERTGRKPVQAKDDSDFYQQDIGKIMFRLLPERMEEVKAYVAERLHSDDYSGFQTNVHMFEFANKKANKGYALKQYLKMHDLDPEECLAFGDTTNDNDILAACVGVCLANGTDDTKALARYITEKPCAEDGFSDFVRRHLL